MMSLAEQERAVLDEHEPRWVRLGYRVIRHPRGTDVPEFLGRFQPDALAIGPQPNLVVEVIRKGARNADEKVRRLKALLGDRKDWRLEVLYSGEVAEGLRSSSPEDIHDVLRASRRLTEKEPRAAFLLAWAVLEAVVRRLAPQDAQFPQSAGRLVELLASGGYITPTEADRLRYAVALRNRLAHGDLSVRLAPAETRTVLEIAEGLLHQMQEDP
ncbi:MAG: hypothetical protein KDA49_01010 [Rhodospirillaceae bacterium]|nr:hypothetical protein [Rhodospirillaceae bacterium]MCA8931014.1 hypothetical protein [Rhodospirillaceae bacterium]